MSISRDDLLQVSAYCFETESKVFTDTQTSRVRFYIEEISKSFMFLHCLMALEVLRNFNETVTMNFFAISFQIIRYFF